VRVEIPFAGPAYESESGFVSPQECINLYARPYPAAGKGKLALFGTPGLELFMDLDVNFPVRGLIAVAGNVYVVAGISLFQVSVTGYKTLMGELGSYTGNRVSMASNGVDITLVDGTNGYTLDLSTKAFTQITDSNFPGGDVIVQIDGYYLVNRPGTGQIYRSDWNNGLSWGGLAFSTAGGDPDNVVGLIVDHLDVW
jgi:hypothetical protein